MKACRSPSSSRLGKSWFIATSLGTKRGSTASSEDVNARPPLATRQQLAQDPSPGIQPGSDVGGGRGVERRLAGEGHRVDARPLVQAAPAGLLRRRELAAQGLEKPRHRDLLRTADGVTRLVVALD
jgi:hypothetical protein